MRASTLRRWMNLWPPFLFSGIQVDHIAPDYSRAEVSLHLRWYNRNYVGSHFGGSLFAMTDPFWMLLALRRLGNDYIVWDQAGEIAFVRPGRSTVRASFHLDDASVDSLREEAAGGGKVLRWFDTEVVDTEGEVVARVRKQLYVRLKRGRSTASA